MRAVRTGDGEFTVVEVDEPDPSYSEVVVDIAASGICGSDLHIYSGRIPIEMGFTIGHEYVGTVVDVGKEVGEVAVRGVYGLRRLEVEERPGDGAAPGPLEREHALITDELGRQGLELSEAEALVAQIEQRREEHVPGEAPEGVDEERRHG